MLGGVAPDGPSWSPADGDHRQDGSVATGRCLVVVDIGRRGARAIIAGARKVAECAPDPSPIGI